MAHQSPALLHHFQEHQHRGRGDGLGAEQPHGGRGEAMSGASDGVYHAKTSIFSMGHYRKTIGKWRLNGILWDLWK